MTWYPMAFMPPQYEKTAGQPYSGAVIKAYAETTTDTIPMATDITGVTTADSFVLNSAGYPTSGGMVIIPHVQENYKLALYPTQAAADADSGAIWTVDKINIAAVENQAFVQSFSGDGTTTGFTLSEDLGTDERTVMIFADKKFGEYSTNGSFSSDTGWTKGTGWSIAAGVASATTASADLSQTPAIPILNQESYTLTYTITRSAGDITPKIGGVAGVTRNSAGTYTETIIAGNTQAIAFTGNGFTGTVDNVSIHRTTASRREILRPDEFTLNGTSLTFTEAPITGTSNIIVFAPSLLFGAVGAAAAAAATSEANALTYKNAAEAARDDAIDAKDDAVQAKNDAEALYGDLNAVEAAVTDAETAAAEAALSAAKLTATSTTSNSIGTGSKSFTIEANKDFGAGRHILITSNADAPNRRMSGIVSSYNSGTGALVVNVESTTGSGGPYTDWTLKIDGERGANSSNENVTVANSTANYAIDYNNGPNFDITLTANCTFTITNPPANSGAFNMRLKQDATGGRTRTWPASVKWPNGTVPTLVTTANSVSVLTFVTFDGGTTWDGFVAGTGIA